MSHLPPRSGAGKPVGPSKHTPIPTEWRIELPESGARADSEFGGCRSIEAGYVRGPVLGQGTYGEVYLAHDLQTKEKVAAKKIKMDNEKEGFPITAIREIKILSALAGAKEKLEDGTLLRNNVIGLREIVRSGSHKANNFKGSIYMMFDYMDHDMTGLLERSQREGRRFTAPQVKCYLRQLFCGLALLETHDVLHRDLKNANLLVSNDGELKIADFGLARYVAPSGAGAGAGGVDRPMTNRVITLWYRPPELFLGSERYGTEIDMWSAGCIMFELLTGKPLFPGKDETDQWDKIFAVVGQPTEQSMPGSSKYPNIGMVAQRYPKASRLRQHCESRGIKDPHALDLLEKLLALNPKQRMSAAECVTHMYFYAAPKPCQPSEMPKFASSHEMTMKRARHEQRHGGAQQPRQGQQQQAGQQGQQAGQQQAHHAGQQQHGGQPPQQRQRTHGQYAGPQGGAPLGQYRGGGTGGGAPAAGGVGVMGGGAGGMHGVMPGGGMAAGGMPMAAGMILTQAQVQQMQMGAMPLPMAQVGMMPAAMMNQAQQQHMGQQQRQGGYGGQQGGGQPGQRYGPTTGAAPQAAHPHRMGGGAKPAWDMGRR